MDPLAHTFTGAALAAAGLRRATPLATAALLIGVNIPDVDVLASFAGGFEQLAFRRGWTHGVLALALWPLVVTGALLLWDRHARRRRDAAAPPARAGPLLALATLAVVSHPTLDWFNNYGLRWLMPFDGRWFYGDALFVIDPWVWLTLGGVLFLAHSRSRASLAAWAVFWALASLAVLANTALVPLAARVLWVCGLAGLVAARALGVAALRHPAAMERTAAAALGLFALYAVAAVTASSAARTRVHDELAARGISGVERVMVAPTPANPFGGDIVAATADAYYTGRWNWLARPRVEIETEALPRPRGAAFEAAARAEDARDFLTWARFPFVELEPAPDGALLVRFTDVRYRVTGRLNGPTVRLDRELRPSASD
jgi:inner membrane protein